MNKTKFYEVLYLKKDTEDILNIFNVSVSLHKKKGTFGDNERQ